MRPEIVRLVFPVFTTGLERKQDLAAGEPLDFRLVQRELSGLLNNTKQTDAWVHSGRVVDGFLGIQYALTCWIDELFIQDAGSPWRDRDGKTWAENWSEHSLEWEMFNHQDRAWMFWEQCGIARRRLAETDALEVFYLCVVLGFRGIARTAEAEATRDWPDAPQGGNVQRWCDEVLSQLGLQQTIAPPEVEQLEPKVPPLEGATSFQTMLTVWAICVFGLAPFVGYLIPALLVAFGR